MSQATRAKSAQARATIAARILKACPAHRSLSRAFDDCFEMGDGAEVRRLLTVRSVLDDALFDSLKRHGCNDWVAEAEALRAVVAKEKH